MRKRKWWIISAGVFLLVVCGFWLASPPPLPKFLQKFKSRTQLLRSGFSEHEHRIETQWLVDAPAEEVTLAMAEELGDSKIILYFRSARDSLGSGNYSVGAVRSGTRRQTYVSRNTPFESMSAVDRLVVSLLPSLLDIRSFETTNKANLNLSVDRTFDRNAIIKKRPKLKVYENR
ncbi:MAG: hypothetical protein ABL962_15975 [Fimbriimonadaceae bacterium]